MAGCTNENWTLQDLSTALQDMHKDNKKIVVPMFQRGKRWSKAQEKAFIDSLVKGYPVGTMLFYETFEDNKRTYILVDGLQRGNSIKKFMNNPTEFFFDDSMPYEKPEDFAVLKEYYTEYCTKRFDKMKHLFCDSLGITYEEVDTSEKIVETIIIPKQFHTQKKQIKFADKCVLRLAQKLDKELVKIGRSTYATIDNSQGFIITTSKAYRQGKRDKYWFAYRRNPLSDLERCTEKFVIYGCKDENTEVLK